VFFCLNKNRQIGESNLSEAKSLGSLNPALLVQTFGASLRSRRYIAIPPWAPQKTRSIYERVF